MKKQFYLLILLIAVFFTATSQTTVVNQLQIKTVPTDTTATDVLVRGADRKVKKVPISFLKGGGSATDKSFQQILNQPWDNFIHTFSGGLKFENPYASVFAYRDGIIIERTSLTSTPSKAELLSSGVAYTDSFGKRTFTNYPSNGSFDKTFAVSVNGNYADQYGNITIPLGGSAPTLQEVLDTNPYAKNKLIGLEFGTYGTENYESTMLGSPYGFYNEQGIYGSPKYRRSVLNTDKGLIIKSTSLGTGEMQLKADNLENNDVYLQAPKLSGTIPISVNGNKADQDGNITIPLQSTPTLQNIADATGLSVNFDNGITINNSLGSSSTIIKPTEIETTDELGHFSTILPGHGYFKFPTKTRDLFHIPISVNGNYADDSGNITVNSIASSGSYSPTFEVISNLSNVTGGATPSYYTRVGNVVTVYIRFFNNQSAANTATAFRASLPFPRATTNQINYVGTGTVGYGGVESDIPCRVFFEPGQTSCRISYYTKSVTGTQNGVVSLQYSVDE